MERKTTKNLTAIKQEITQKKQQEKSKTPKRHQSTKSVEEKENLTEEFIGKRQTQFNLLQKFWNKLLGMSAFDEGGSDNKRIWFINTSYEALKPILTKYAIKTSKKEIEILSDPTDLPGYSFKESMGNFWRLFKATKTDFFLKDISSLFVGISDYDSLVKDCTYDLSSLLVRQNLPTRDKKWLRVLTPEILMQVSEITEALDQNVIPNTFTEKEIKNAINSVLGRYYKLDTVDLLKINPSWTIPTYIQEIKDMIKKKTFTPEKQNEVFCQLLYLVPHFRFSRYSNYEQLFGWRYHDPIISDLGQPEVRLSQVASMGHYLKYSATSIIDDRSLTFIPGKERIDVLTYQSLRTGQLRMLKDYIKLLKDIGLFEIDPKLISEAKESF